MFKENEVMINAAAAEAAAAVDAPAPRPCALAAAGVINVSLVGALDLASGAGLYANGAGVDGEGQTDWNNGLWALAAASHLVTSSCLYTIYYCRLLLHIYIIVPPYGNSHTN